MGHGLAQINVYLLAFDLEACFQDQLPSALKCKFMGNWLLHRKLTKFHKSGVPIVNAELPNPSSCFIVPLSMGQSLGSMPFQSAHCLRKPVKLIENSTFCLF